MKFRSFLLMVLVIRFIGSAAVVFAQSAEELQLMSLYFPKKELVVSVTRYPQPVSKTAENVTIITGDEIRNMNAHTVSDVLYRIPGVFSTSYKELGAPSSITMQGGEDRHVLVLLDGIEWNYLTGSNAETSTLPVGIIDRIEVIQGPASSAWGSSLGGVINIITKSAGKTAKPTGYAGVSIGESGTFDYNGQVSGKAGPVGYYLYAGGQSTDGVENDRGFDNKSFYSKFRLPFSGWAGLTLSAGYSSPDSNQGTVTQGPFEFGSESELASWHVEAALGGDLTDRLEYKLSAYYLRQSADLISTSLGNTGMDSAGDLLYSDGIVEKTHGGSGKLVWKGADQVIVLGADYLHGKAEQTLGFGPIYQRLTGTPAELASSSTLEKWALFMNDAISLDRLTVTPGIRFDHNSITGTFVSPSLGMAYHINGKTILRATVARGFTYPSLTALSSGGPSVDPNPSLDPETVWSYQAGVETVAIDNLWIRLDLFYHDQANALDVVSEQGAAGRYITVNSGSLHRMGAELSVRTRPYHHLSLFAGGLYVDLDPQNEDGSNQRFSVTLGLEYDNPAIFYAQLFGRYESWDLPDQFESNDSDMIWELNFHRKLFRWHQVESRVFLTVHNIFSGAQYVVGDFPNPPRWIEGGLRCYF